MAGLPGETAPGYAASVPLGVHQLAVLAAVAELPGAPADRLAAALCASGWLITGPRVRPVTASLVMRGLLAAEGAGYRLTGEGEAER